MIAEAELGEYLDEIRKHVCSRCVERPVGGPPCAPLGKDCGVEMHLPQLIESIREVHSDLGEPYLEHNRQQICAGCAFLHSSICPCPMDYLSILVVEAVEAVDQRRQERGESQPTAPVPAKEEGILLEEVRRAYALGTGSWRGCDWPTTCGKTHLDLNGWTAAGAEAMARQYHGTEVGEDWRLAAGWLAQIEHKARQAEEHAAAAVAAANLGAWKQALQHAEAARSLEYCTGRAIWHSFPIAWQRLRRTVAEAYAHH